MIYSLRHKSSEKINYLFGTMHVRNDDAYTYVDMAKRYIDQCQSYAAEMDLGEAENFNISQYFFLPEGTTLNQYFKPRKYDKMRRLIMKAYQIDLDQISTFLPLFVANMLSEKVLNDDNQLPLDKFLWQYAIDHDKLMKGVESPEDQVRILQSVPLDYQLKNLKDIVRNITKFNKSVLKLSRYYAKGEVHKIYKLSKKSMGGIKDVMIYNRNYQMADSINRLIIENSTFIAIGAGHLSGKFGLIRLLKASGMKVKRLD